MRRDEESVGEGFQQTPSVNASNWAALRDAIFDDRPTNGARVGNTDRRTAGLSIRAVSRVLEADGEDDSPTPTAGVDCRCLPWPWWGFAIFALSAVASIVLVVMAVEAVLAWIGGGA